jgi:ribosomal protein S18 acetylase RimI-like enzyme
MHIRYYRPEDDPSLMRLERLSPRGLPEPFVHYRRRFIDRAAIFADHQLLVAEEGGAIVGAIAVAVKRTHVGGQPVSLGYVFDLRTDPVVRRRGIGTALCEAVDEYLIRREIDGAYAHVVTTNIPSLKLFQKVGFARLRQLVMLIFQPYPAMDFPDYMPRHIDDFSTDSDLIQAVYSSRDMYVPDVASRVKDYGFQRWSVDVGGAGFTGISLFDQSFVFQQWPAEKPIPSEDEMRMRGEKCLRLFDVVGFHNPALLEGIFVILRDLAVTDNVSKLTLLLDRMERIPTYFYSEALKQLDYWMLFKSLNPDWAPEWQDTPMYVDSREL